MDQKRIKLIIAMAILSVIFTAVFLIYTDKYKVEITSSPDNVQVRIGKKTYTTPIIIKLRSGTYDISASKTGYVSDYQELVVLKDKKNEYKIVLRAVRDMDPADSSIYPIIDKLPFESKNFSINWKDDDGFFQIVPKIKLNSSESYYVQIARQWTAYDTYAHQGLVWLKQHGVKPSPKNVSFWGEDWWPRGKSIKF